MNTRTQLRKKLPHGTLRLIAKRANVTPKSVSEFFSKGRNSRRIEMATIEVLEEMKAQRENFLNKVNSALEV